jgi:hypothetical protein
VLVSSCTGAAFHTGAKSLGNGVVAVAIDAAFDLAGRADVTLLYVRKRTFLTVARNRAEAVIPVYDGQVLEVTVQCGEKGKRLSLTVGSQPATAAGRFRAKAVQTNEIGICVTFEFSSYDRVAAVSVGAPEPAAVDEALSFATHALVSRWLTAADVAPPLDLYFSPQCKIFAATLVVALGRRVRSV